MLAFCEECGCKNLLKDAEKDRETVRFRCVSCDYENIWQQPRKKEDKENRQRTVVDPSKQAKSSGMQTKLGKNE